MMKSVKYYFDLLIVQLLFCVFPTMIISGELSSNYFNMSLQDLMDVEVVLTTAGKTPEKIADIPASVVLVDREDIERFGYRSIEEILNNIPGLYPTNDYSWDGQNYGVRGFWSGVVNRHMIIMVNGVNQVNDFQSNFPVTGINVPVEAIDRIEVIRGPMSVIYGTGAFFGVINIVTNEQSDIVEEKTKLSASYGTANSYDFTLRSFYEQENVKHKLNISFSGTDGIHQPLNQMSSANLAGSTEKKLSRKNIYFNLYSAYKSLFSEISYVEANNENYLFYPSFSKGSIYRTNKILATVGFNQSLTSSFLFSAKFNYQNANYQNDYDWFMDDFIAGQRIQTTAYEFDMNLKYDSNKNLNALFGFGSRSAFSISNKVDFSSIPGDLLDNLNVKLADDNSVATYAFYSQVNYRPLDRLKLVAGLRTENMPEYDMNILAAPTAPAALTPAEVWTVNYVHDEWDLIPRLAALYTINSDHIIKLLYGQAINRPSFHQTTDDIFAIQNRLKPERITTSEINYLGSFSSGYTISLSLFRNELANLLIRDHELDEVTGAYSSFFSNAGEMQTHGVEFTLKTKILENLLCDASFTYQETEDQNRSDIKVAYSPTWLGYFQASYAMKNTTMAITARYVDAMYPYYDPILQNLDGSVGGRIGENVAGYVSVGANIRIDNILDKFYLNVHGINLLDEDIHFPVFTNNPWADKGTMDWGRRFIITIGMQF